MKSEERHQLLTNDLQVVTTRTVGYFEKHLEAIIAVVCAFVVLVAAVVWWNQSSVSDNTAGWTMLDSAKNLEDFEAVADRFKGKLPGQWAKLRIAERNLQNALPAMFVNRDLALAELKTAREAFESLAADKTVPAAIKERSLWGIAQALEATCDGNTSKCVEALNRLLTEFPETMFKSVATERVAALKKPAAEEFYTWFSKENPKPLDARPDDFKFGGDNLPGAKFDEKDLEAPNADGGKDDQPADAINPANPDKPAVNEQPAANEPAKDGNPPPADKK